MPVLLIFNLYFNQKTWGIFSITKSLNVNDSHCKQAAVWSTWRDVTILITLRHDVITTWAKCHVHRRAFEKRQPLMSRDISIPTMWYVRPAKTQISLRIQAVWSELLLVALIFYACYATDWKSFGVSKLKRRLHRLVWVYTCQREITCRCSN